MSGARPRQLRQLRQLSVKERARTSTDAPDMRVKFSHDGAPFGQQALDATGNAQGFALRPLTREGFRAKSPAKFGVRGYNPPKSSEGRRALISDLEQQVDELSMSITDGISKGIARSQRRNRQRQGGAHSMASSPAHSSGRQQPRQQRVVRHAAGVARRPPKGARAVPPLRHPAVFSLYFC